MSTDAAVATRIVAIDPARDARWDAFVRSRPEASPYHLGAWAAILRRAYSYRPRYLAAEDADGGLTGVLPLLHGRGLLGSRLTSMPVAWAAGPLSVGLEVDGALLRAAHQKAVELGAGRLLVKSPRRGLEALAPGVHALPYAPAWVVDAGDDLDELEARWKATRRMRRSLQRAERAGLTVRESADDGDLRRFHRLYLATMRRHRALPRSLRQLRLARDLLAPGVFRLTVVERDGELICGLLHYETGDRMLTILNASLPGHLDVRPNHAAYAEAIRGAHRRGVRTVDLGGAGDDTDLAEFKRQWGAEREAVHAYAWSASGPPDAPAEGGGVPGGARVEALWDRAPLKLTEVAATAAYRLL